MDQANAAPAPRDLTQIHASSEADIRYWMRKFGVSESQLRAAVRQVGSSPERVAARLGKVLPGRIVSRQYAR